MKSSWLAYTRQREFDTSNGFTSIFLYLALSANNTYGQNIYHRPNLTSKKNKIVEEALGMHLARYLVEDLSHI